MTVPTEPNVGKHTATGRLVDLIPQGWFEIPENSSVWVRCYRVFGVAHETVTPPVSIDLAEVRAVLLSGSLHYHGASTVEFPSDTARLIVSPGERDTPDGRYLLLFAPYARDGVAGDEQLTRDRLSSAAGVLAAFGGRNLVYETVFEQLLSLAGDETTVISPSWEEPLALPAPDVNAAAREAIAAADATAAALGETDRNRVRLSLRWFEMAHYETGVDALLRYWIAIETLGMPDGTDIRPLNQALVRIYERAAEDVGAFGVGRLFGLRSAIVHDGRIVHIHSDILDYLQALYTDILLDHLDCPSLRRVEAVLARSDVVGLLSATLSS